MARRRDRAENIALDPVPYHCPASGPALGRERGLDEGHREVVMSGIDKRTFRTECWECKHQREVIGSAHIACAKPSLTIMKSGDPHGIKRGWFFYPLNFDPTWKTQYCENFESVNPVVSPAISQAVSQEKA